MKRHIFLAVTLSIASPSMAGGMSECMAIRALAEDLVSNARSAEYVLANEKCPEKNFRTKLNSVSNWAWTTDTNARQLCRNNWRESTPYLYQDLFGNGYRSRAGVQMAKDLEVLGVELARGKCPVSDLTWQPESEVKPKELNSKASWEEKLKANLPLRDWAEQFPNLAEKEKLKWINSE